MSPYRLVSGFALAAALLVGLAAVPDVLRAEPLPAWAAQGDLPEPGLQGQRAPGDKPGAVLERPYSKGVKVVGYDSIAGRDSNVQLTWADHCAYVASTPLNFLGWAVKPNAAETSGVAVMDVKNPHDPKLVRLLREPGALYAAETMHAVLAPGHKVLAAGAYSNGKGGATPNANPAYLDLYDISDCAHPKLKSEYIWPDNAHSVRVSPDGRYVYGTVISPFTGKGGLQVLDISDLAHPRFVGKFQATRADGTSFDFAPHEVSFSADGRRIYAGVIASTGGDLNQGRPLLPPSRAELGSDGGGVYILDNSDIVDRKPDPKLRLIGEVQRGGWHSIMPANINGVPHLVGGAELTACPGTWPVIDNIADETKPFVEGEFKLAMNQAENCPAPTAMEKGSGGIVPSPGTATLHFNDVDSATHTRLGLFNFMWGGFRIADLKDPAHPVEVAYFKPGDACTGHARYMPQTGQIWFVCGASGFYVIELEPKLRASLGMPALGAARRKR